MSTRLGTVALECFGDLGITIVYAILAGLLIVVVVASDQGALPLLWVGLYALLLPAFATLLVGSEMALRVFQEWRALRHSASGGVKIFLR